MTTAPSDDVAHQPTEKLRRLDANYIRAIAALAVVQIHCVGELVYNYQKDNPYDLNWWTGNVYYTLLRWATPFFIMLSGSLSLVSSKAETTREFLFKRIRRVMVPFAFWGGIYIIYENRGFIRDGKMPFWPAIQHKILFEDIYYHLWFIPMIMGLYLLTPTFRIWAQHAKKGDIEYFLALSFSITALQHFIPNLFIVKYVGWLGYIGFYILGYYLSRYRVPWIGRIYPLALLMLPLTAIGTWLYSRYGGTYVNTLFVYFSPNVVIITFAWFVFLKTRDWSGFAARFPRLHEGVTRFADRSFGVYFVHVLLIDLLKNGYLWGIRVTPTVFFNHPVHPVPGAFIQAVLVVAMSYLLVRALLAIPGVRKVIL